MNKKTTEERAWELYCKETAGDCDVRDFWEELPSHVQKFYIIQALEYPYGVVK